MKTFELTVWYYYEYYGQLEKEFEIYEIEAETLSEAVEIARNKHRGTIVVYYKNKKVN